MKRTFAAIGIAVSLVLAAVSCTKDLNTDVDFSSSSTISLNVSASLPDYDEATKGSLKNNIRVVWTEGDFVYVYDNAKCLGTLTAALEDGNDRYAVLSGTITASQSSKLTLVAASAGLTPSVNTQGTSLTSGITFDLSAQSLDKGQAPYVVYAIIDNPTGTGVSNVKTSFSFATSVINVNCTALKEGTPVSKATLSSVNTVLNITPKADAVPAITSGTEGTITRTGAEDGALGIANAEGVLIFSVAVLDQTETADRKIHVSQSGWPSSASFSAAALTKGTSYNTVCQLSGPYKTIGGHSGVRLWADGPYWATCNIGAESPTDNGYYYMWGSTQGYEYRGGKFYKVGTDTEIASGGFTWDNYKFGNFDSSDIVNYGFTKYQKTDNKTKLEPIDDAAAIEWGSGWRMPTGGENGEFQKLYDNCVWTWNGELGGYLVTGKEEYAGISVFFPAAGDGIGTSLNDAGSSGYCWSSTLTSSNPRNAYYLRFNSDDVYPQYYIRRYTGFRLGDRSGFADDGNDLKSLLAQNIRNDLRFFRQSAAECNPDPLVAHTLAELCDLSQARPAAVSKRLDRAAGLIEAAVFLFFIFLFIFKQIFKFCIYCFFICSYKL